MMLICQLFIVKVTGWYISVVLKTRCIESYDNNNNNRFTVLCLGLPR